MNFAPRASYVKSRRRTESMGCAGAGEKVVAVVEGGCFVCGWFDPRRLVLVSAMVVSAAAAAAKRGEGERRAGEGARTCPDARPAVVEDEVTDWDRGHGCTGSRLCNTKSTTVVAMAAGECGDARELATVP